MIEYITSFFKEFEFDTAARIDAALAYEKIIASRESAAALRRLCRGYEKDNAFIKNESYREIEIMARESGVHPYTAELVAHVCLTKTLRERLLKLGYAKKNVISTLTDFRIKCGECKRLFGIWGINNWQWYTRLYSLRIIGIGRLQFELREFQIGTYRKGGRMIKKHDNVLSVHIPRTDTPLDQRACQRAYAEAKECFCRMLGCENIPFYCSSWLLYHKNRDFLDEKSNIVKFMNSYEILKYEEFAEGGGDLLPFLFEKPKGTPIEQLPTDTSLRASYAAYLASGGLGGVGTGIFFLE